MNPTTVSRITVACLLLSLIGLNSCQSAPRTFRESEPTWSSVELREGASFEKAWREVVDVLAKDFELEMISKDGGYVRTAWLPYARMSGKAAERYNVRAIVKFASDRNKLDIKTEARYLDDGYWKHGYDDAFLRKIKTDLMGVVARTVH